MGIRSNWWKSQLHLGFNLDFSNLQSLVKFNTNPILIVLHLDLYNHYHGKIFSYLIKTHSYLFIFILTWFILSCASISMIHLILSNRGRRPWERSSKTPLFFRLGQSWIWEWIQRSDKCVFNILRLSFKSEIYYTNNFKVYVGFTKYYKDNISMHQGKYKAMTHSLWIKMHFLHFI